MTTGEPYSEPEGNVDLPPEYMQDDSDTGSSASQQLASKARQGADQVKQTASAAADQVKQTASAATDQVKQSAMSEATSRKDQAAQSLTTVSQAVNQAARKLRQNNQPSIAQAAESAASNINQFANYLRSRNVNEIIGEVEDFASSQPALFLGGAFLLGVVGARFLKSSRAGMSQPSARPSRSQQQWSNQSGSYSDVDTSSYTVGLPGTGDNINTGGLAYGRNLPPEGSDYPRASRPANPASRPLANDEDFISGETPH